MLLTKAYNIHFDRILYLFLVSKVYNTSKEIPNPFRNTILQQILICKIPRWNDWIFFRIFTNSVIRVRSHRRGGCDVTNKYS